ncbi:histidine phosphatase family protein [Hyphomicrobium sp.]|uniref:histidine phosphatase family protein n=1 Tax=Hyphomicrobium sp. TaxID=82 RepID=UPI000FA9A886|nr:histidine phosphatase family protein [Hyphomicrobium sp.]RUO97498.1 MAG: histidine phosphatase family protein [Hyphomicrobium sp.]
MPPRLTFVACAATPAVRAAAFPLDETLDEAGKRDAVKKGEEFRLQSPTLTGPETRAIETAALLGLEGVVEPALRDLDVGRWAGCSLSGVAACEPDALAAWLSDCSAAPHGGESIEALFSRVSTWLQTISTRRGRLIAVTHPAVIRVAVLAAIQAGPGSFWNIDVSPLTVVDLTSNGIRWALKSIAS